ncbi:MAG: fumarylacetoacetate hydrolase [Chloroflexi bacterium]|nr:fumarylacetoacetate hydrolase [Chloroflexota bacterium]
MRLVLYGEEFRLGLLNGDRVVDASSVSDRIPHNTPQQMISKLIGEFDRYRSELEGILDNVQGVPASEVRFRAPIPRPPRLVCMAGNYMENGTLEKPNPLSAFNKSSSSIIGDSDTVTLPDFDPRIFEHEAELAIVIGKRAERILEEDAYDYIFGYTNFIDVSHRGRDDDGKRHNFFDGKSFDTFGPLGPAIITADEVDDPQNLPVKLWVQGDLRQDYNTNDMGHTIKQTLAWVTWVTTLHPGDIVACGTNHRGLGPVQDGDQVEVEVSNFGRLTVSVRDDLKRSWPRMTRAQMEAK